MNTDLFFRLLVWAVVMPIVAPCLLFIGLVAVITFDYYTGTDGVGVILFILNQWRV